MGIFVYRIRLDMEQLREEGAWGPMAMVNAGSQGKPRNMSHPSRRDGVGARTKMQQLNSRWQNLSKAK